jgi:hypothetical protein
MPLPALTARCSLRHFRARLRAMLRLQPLARPVDLQSSTVDQHVQRTVRRLRGQKHRQLHRPTADRGVIRRWNRQVHQREDRCQQALGLSQRQPDAARSIRLERAGIRGRAAAAWKPDFVDRGHRAGLLADLRTGRPSSGTSPSRPHLERHLRDVVAAIGVVFVRHRAAQAGECACYCPLQDLWSAPTPR